ncbi:MAG: M56 family metallopeptidase [Gammaproteobacteria bacterium]|nr:M56 family metallopeptidase [Gammaproteobacteria bacterium]
MIEYFILSAELSLLGTVAFACLRSAPACWRLCTAATVLVLSLFPWSLLPAITVSGGFVAAPVLEALPLLAPPTGTGFAELPTVQAETTREVPWIAILALALSLGLAAFTLLVLRQRASLRRWREVARSGDHLRGDLPRQIQTKCDIRILPGSTCAAATGVLKPTVWIGERRLDDPRLPTVLAHELLHVGRHHALLAIMLTLLRCLFWWQPFAWLWVWLARRELEHDCDEACAELLGYADYRATLASLIHDAVPQAPGLALVGLRSANLRRVRNLETVKTPGIRHRIALALALGTVPLIAAEVAVDPTGNHKSREELLQSVIAMHEGAGGKPGILTTAGYPLGGYSFMTSGIGALKSLSDSDPRPYYLHPDVAYSLDDIDVKIAGTYDEVVRAVAKELGLEARTDPTSVVIAEATSLTKLDWIERAIVLSGIPARQVRMAIDLEVDGKALEKPVDLVLGMSNWAGFDIGDCPISLMAERIDDAGVDLEFRIKFGSIGMTWNRRVEYSTPVSVLRNGKIPCPDARNEYRWRTVVLRTTVEPVDAVAER